MNVNANETTELRKVLLGCIHPGPSVVPSHLQVVERNFAIASTNTLVHCYAPTLDANGRVRIRQLAEFMRDRVFRFVIPKRDIQAAEKVRHETGDLSDYVRIHERAKHSFTTIRNTGEVGEFLLFALAEKEFSLTQILSKMSLKTSSSMHYHGADGIYASLDDTGVLRLFWGESKLYENPTAAITDCLKSLAPHLAGGLGTGTASAQDIVLLNEYADIGDDHACAILKRFLDPSDPQAQKLRICGIALVTFDNEAFPKEGETGGIWEKIEIAIKKELPSWKAHIAKRIDIELLTGFDIHFICLPMACADDFRSAFLELLGAGP